MFIVTLRNATTFGRLVQNIDKKGAKPKMRKTFWYVIYSSNTPFQSRLTLDFFPNVWLKSKYTLMTYVIKSIFVNLPTYIKITMPPFLARKWIPLFRFYGQFSSKSKEQWKKRSNHYVYVIIILCTRINKPT